jgi:hypothetical protein
MPTLPLLSEVPRRGWPAAAVPWLFGLLRQQLLHFLQQSCRLHRLLHKLVYGQVVRIRAEAQRRGLVDGREQQDGDVGVLSIL